MGLGNLLHFEMWDQEYVTLLKVDLGNFYIFEIENKRPKILEIENLFFRLLKRDYGFSVFIFRYHGHALVQF